MELPESDLGDRTPSGSMELPESDLGGRVPLGSIMPPDLTQPGTYKVTHCQSTSRKPAGAGRLARGRAWTAPDARTSRAKARAMERIARSIRSLLSGGRASGRHGRRGLPGEEWHRSCPGGRDFSPGGRGYTGWVFGGFPNASQ